MPTKGQRTKANGKSHTNQNPYKRLTISLSFYDEFQVAYKRKELVLNGRYLELKKFDQAQIDKEKMKKADKRQSRIRAKQEYMRNLNLNK